MTTSLCDHSSVTTVSQLRTRGLVKRREMTVARDVETRRHCSDSRHSPTPCYYREY